MENNQIPQIPVSPSPKSQTLNPNSSPSKSTDQMESPAAAAAPWVDLPEGLTELILERLPIADYIRFAAVCPKWRSIQRHHRLRRRSPLPLPWVCAYPCLSERAQVLFPMICFSPFDARPNNPNPNPLPPSKCHSFPLPNTAGFEYFPIASSSNGWLILLKDPDERDACQDDPPTQVLLFDPVSGSHLTLPPVALGIIASTGCMSYPPTHPDCALIIPSADSVFLWRVGQPGWAKLPCPNTVSTLRRQVRSSVFRGGKFYFLLPADLLKFSLFVVDTLLNVVQLVDMGWSHTPFTHNMWSSGWRMERLVECNGDLLMVLAASVPEGTVRYPLLKELLVFKADFSRKMWARVQSLGGFALFVSRACSFSLPAADVGVAENSVYFCDSYKSMGATLWTAFDLGAGRVLHGPPIPHTYLKKYHSMLLTQDNFWFIPRLASVTPASD